VPEGGFAPPPFRLSQAATTGGCAAKIGSARELS
jgi:hypothetical protein